MGEKLAITEAIGYRNALEAYKAVRAQAWGLFSQMSGADKLFGEYTPVAADGTSYPMKVTVQSDADGHTADQTTLHVAIDYPIMGSDLSVSIARVTLPPLTHGNPHEIRSIVNDYPEFAIVGNMLQAVGTPELPKFEAVRSVPHQPSE